MDPAPDHGTLKPGTTGQSPHASDDDEFETHLSFNVSRASRSPPSGPPTVSISSTIQPKFDSSPQIIQSPHPVYAPGVGRGDLTPGFLNPHSNSSSDSGSRLPSISRPGSEIPRVIGTPQPLTPLGFQFDERIESISHSVFSFSYSYDTWDVINSRFQSVLRSLEKLRTASIPGLSSGAAGAAPLLRRASTLDLTTLLKHPDSAEIILQAKQSMKEKGKIETYIDTVQDALQLKTRGTRDLPGQQGIQRIAMPILNSRKESAGWLESINRLMDSPAITRPDTPQSESAVSDSGLEDDVVKLLEVLSMPYIDILNNLNDAPQQTKKSTKPSLLRRASSFVSIPIFERRKSDVGTTSNPVGDPTPLFQIPSKQPGRNAVFTTSVSAPYSLLSLNDIACLMFGATQSDPGKRTIGDFVSESLRDPLVRLLEQGMEKGLSVPISGEVFDIRKDNNTQGVASFWVERSSHVLVWVIEEINLNMEEFLISPEGDLDPLNVLRPEVELENVDQLGCHILSYPEHELFYDTVEVANRNTPALLSHSTSPSGEKVLSVREFRAVATGIVLDTSYRILSYNEAAIHNLLGIDKSRNLRGEMVDIFIPLFMQYRSAIDKLCKLSWMPGVVIPEHMFRQVACESSSDYFEAFPQDGVTAVTVRGTEIFVDLQLRIISKDECVLWVSFSRPTVGDQASCAVPSQLELLNIPKRRHPTSSTASSDSTPSTPKSERRGEADSPQLSHLAKISRDGDVSPFLVVPDAAKPPSIRVPIIVGAHRREKTLKDFNILQTLGEGAYGRVVLAQFKKVVDAPVIALKSILKDRILVDTWTRDKKLGTIPNEIKVMYQLLKLPHPNVVELIDFFEDEKHYHVEMVRHGNPGSDLFDFIEDNHDLTEIAAKHIFIQVVSAVAHLHDLRIVHRDIKDENIIIDGNGVVKLIDFGSAAYVNQGPFDVFVGTVDYAAPEILKGLPFEGPSQDIWALGILMYTILYKENPFYDVDEIIKAQIKPSYEVSPESSALLARILHKDYNDRPSATQILEDPWFDGVEKPQGLPPNEVSAL